MEGGIKRKDAFEVLSATSTKNWSRKKVQGSRKGSSYAECVVCGTSIFHAYLDSHVQICLEQDSVTKKQASSTVPQPAFTAKDGPKASQSFKEETQDHAKLENQKSATNVLQALMQAQRAKSRVTRDQFHLDCTNGVWRISWQKKFASSKETKVAWEGHMDVKEHNAEGSYVVTLSTNVEPAASNDLSWSSPDLLSNRDAPPDASGRFSPSLLKSTVQKNVRLCRSGPAVRAAMHLFKDHPIEFLRRISIIALEDGILHPDLPFLVWLTVACGKGYQPTRSQISECLRITHELAAVRVRDSLSPSGDDDDNGRMATAACTFAGADATLSPPEALLVKSCLLRASLGGMPGDVKMMRRYAALWHARFLRGAVVPPPPQLPGAAAEGPQSWLQWLLQLYHSLPPPPYAAAASLLRGGQTSQNSSGPVAAAAAAAVDAASVGAMLFSDVPFSAVDFHCSNVVEHICKDSSLRARLLQLQQQQQCRRSSPNPNPWTEEELASLIRSAMWLFRSSINKKTPLGGVDFEHQAERPERESLLPLWSCISEAVDKFAMRHIQWRFRKS